MATKFSRGLQGCDPV